MFKFRYFTKSRDGKMTGNVSANYISGQLMGRVIKSVGWSSDDDTQLEFNLSDGGYVRFLITVEGTDVHYYSPSGK